MTEGRVQSIDCLRGITIFGMILCAAISFGAGLPAWMFHCQVPPPDYAFQPDVRGITWVDLVFPFFIFSLGAAIPFSLGRKLDKGASLLSVSLGIVRRWAILVAFGLALGHSDALAKSPLAPESLSWVRFALWAMLFAALVQTKHKWINIAGWVLTAGSFLLLHYCFSLPLALAQNDCIIILLSTVALLGGFIWLLTRNSRRLRLVIWLLVIVTKIIGWDWAMYLVIALPATVVGDLLREPVSGAPKHYALCAWIALAAVPLQLWGLFTRNVWLDLIITLVLAAAFLWLTFRFREQTTQIGWMGFALLLVGIAVDPLDGGIAKDYCNLSYLFVGGGLASLVLYFLLWVESRRNLSCNLTMTGRNPMIAYTIAWTVVTPLLYAVGLLGLIDSACVGNPLMGALRGIVVTLAAMALTCLCTRFKIYWKS